MNYRRRINDSTLSAVSLDELRHDSTASVADELLLIVECDRPLAASTRHRLGGIDEVELGRGAQRQSRRADGKLQIKIPDNRVSTVHAHLRREGDDLVLVDAGSKNGVIVNEHRVERHCLRDGDVVEIGRTFFRFRRARPRAQAEPLDVDCAELPPPERGLTTFHEPLAAQLRSLGEVARGTVPVLVLGATGTGKELVARAVHALSQRPGPFVGVNCAALADSLLEAELFGARRGAFTGATEDRVGLVRTSDGGTLFLDEIGDLPPRAQAVLLRVLQEKEVLSVGATRPTPVDLRVVTATHRDLEAMSAAGQFRSDLLARIAGFRVRLPPLRERIDDLGILLASLLERHARTGETPTISVEAARALLRYGWPSNIRELEHCLSAALALSPVRIELEHLAAPVRAGRATSPPSSSATPPRELTPEQQARRDELVALLAEHHGNISE
ncbi:MAG TPA: sigma 54-interacting transcriptional regulator, partial [Polyangia bacterium]